MATNWKIVDGNLPYEDNFATPIPNTDISDTNAPDFFFRIIDGDLPFRRTFHSIPSLSGASSLIWSIIDGDYPFKWAFSILYDVEYTSNCLWRIKNGEYPYKISFSELNGINDAPNSIWRIKDGKYPYKIMFPKMYKIERPSKEEPISDAEILILDNTFIIKNKGVYIQPDTEDLNAELSESIQERHDQGLDDVTMEELGDEYNSYINGNVDYNLRPFMKGSKVIPYGWEVDPDSIVSTIDMDYFIYDENENIVYTVKVTPLMENGTILTPEQLGNYVSILQDIVTTDGGDSTNILGYDAEHKKIILNIEDGESQYDSEGMTTLDHELDVVKQKHVILKRIEMIQNEISTMETTSRYLTYEIILEGES
jgi:hypothetical protein